MPSKNNGKTKTENKSGLVNLAPPVTPPDSIATTSSKSPLVDEGEAIIDHAKFKLLLAAKPVPTVIKLLEQARTELKGAYDMRLVFDKFLAVALAALEGERTQAAWEFAKAGYAKQEIDEVTYHSMLLRHNKMQSDWQHLTVEGGLSPVMSRADRPKAARASTFSSNSLLLRPYFWRIVGSNSPLRSRGTRISVSPALERILRLILPLRELLLLRLVAAYFS